MVAFIDVSRHLVVSIFTPENGAIIHGIKCQKRGDFAYTAPKA
jgi:hypothetical protein